MYRVEISNVVLQWNWLRQILTHTEAHADSAKVSPERVQLNFILSRLEVIHYQ